MIRTAFIAIAAFSALSGVAFADPGALPKTHQTEVRLSDIDLSTASGARVALVRIQDAATKVCGGAPDAFTSDNDKQEFASCYTKAVKTSAIATRAPVLISMVQNQAPTLMAKN